MLLNPDESPRGRVIVQIFESPSGISWSKEHFLCSGGEKSLKGFEGMGEDWSTGDESGFRVTVAASELEDDFVVPNHAQFVPGDAFDGFRIGAKGFDLGGEFFDFPAKAGVDLLDFRQLGFELPVPRKALVIEDAQGNGDDGHDEQTERQKPGSILGSSVNRFPHRSRSLPKGEDVAPLSDEADESRMRQIHRSFGGPWMPGPQCAEELPPTRSFGFFPPLCDTVNILRSFFALPASGPYHRSR